MRTSKEIHKCQRMGRNMCVSHIQNSNWEKRLFGKWHALLPMVSGNDYDKLVLVPVTFEKVS